MDYSKEIQESKKGRNQVSKKREKDLLGQRGNYCNRHSGVKSCSRNPYIEREAIGLFFIYKKQYAKAVLFFDFYKEMTIYDFELLFFLYNNE